jgi:hypothetical protein
MSHDTCHFVMFSELKSRPVNILKIEVNAYNGQEGVNIWGLGIQQETNVWVGSPKSPYPQSPGRPIS